MIFILSFILSITHIWHGADGFNSVLVWYSIFTPALFAFIAFRENKKDKIPLYLCALAVSVMHYIVMHMFLSLNYISVVVYLLAFSVSLYCDIVSDE